MSDEERPVEEWDWLVIRAIQAEAHERIWDRTLTPRCRVCDRPLAAGQHGIHLTCFGARR